MTDRRSQRVGARNESQQLLLKAALLDREPALEALSARRAGRVAKAAVNGVLNPLHLGDYLKVTASRAD